MRPPARFAVAQFVYQNGRVLSGEFAAVLGEVPQPPQAQAAQVHAPGRGAVETADIQPRVMVLQARPPPQKEVPPLGQRATGGSLFK